MNPLDITAIVSLALNVAVILIQAKTSSAISELKAHMYEHFATKGDVRYAIRSGKIFDETK